MKESCDTCKMKEFCKVHQIMPMRRYVRKCGFVEWCPYWCGLYNDC